MQPVANALEIETVVATEATAGRDSIILKKTEAANADVCKLENFAELARTVF